MFKKLKLKMLVLNLSILTVLLLAVLSTMYLTSYNDIQKNINEELNRMLVIEPNDFSYPINMDEPYLPNRNVSFMITLSGDDEVIETDSNFTADDDFFTEALSLIDSDEGAFELDGSYWNYKSREINSNTIYVFVDTTSEHNYLTNMLTNFILIFIVSFVLVYLISNFITKRSIDKIKEAFEKQKEFVANASHELKTPLAIISTNADILIDKDKDNKWLGNIRYETDRMNKLTKDLLYLTKMNEQIPEEIMKTRTNLSELLESSILTFEALAYGKNISLTYDIEPEIFLELDPNQINQVFHILLDNAIKYTPENGTVVLKLDTYHNFVNFSIENSGEGINKEDLPNIFERFYMGDKSRSLNEKSYGLGLSIAKTIIDNHQGKIYCESIESEKTTFYIKFKNKTL